MTTLLNVAITVPVAAGLSSTFTPVDISVRSLTLQANFTYVTSSGSPTVNAYVQTSFDGGATWCDAACFSLAKTTEIWIFNLSAETSIASEATPTDGSLTANTCIDGMIGPLWRVKYVTTGTYAAGTSLAIDAYFNGAMALA